MFNSPILDLAILLTFTYFMGSLLLSAVNEAIAGTFRLRPAYLKKALENLILSPDWTAFVQNTLIKSPHIEALMKIKGQYPAYISAENFVLAIIQQLGASQYTSGNLTNAINASNLPPQFKQVLIDLDAKSQSQLSLFEKELAAFYNHAMDRAGGWYKRKIRLILLILGFLMSLTLNIDTIRIANDALKDKARLANAADNITAGLRNITGTDSISIKDTSGNTILVQSTRLDTVFTAETPEKAKEKLTRLKAVYQLDTGYSLGYTSWNNFLEQWKTNFLSKLLGILITAFALQLGSNYWFGLLTKAVDLRAAGKKPNGPIKN
jgi:hypothetical protein